MMKILVAADKFKHSAGSIEVNEAIKAGFLSKDSRFIVKVIPLSDGGDGFLDAIACFVEAERILVQVFDPLFRRIEAAFLLTENKETAFIEMAAASGLLLLKPAEYNCSATSTYGTGELIREAVRLGANRIIVGIGGSATNDCGIGLAAALGFRFLDIAGTELKPIGENLIDIQAIDSSSAIKLDSISIEIACDVLNFLTGETGAAQMFASQKGATPKQVEHLEKGMLHFAEIVKRDLSFEILSLPGGGAAGGTGAGCAAFTGAKLVSGIELLNRFAKLEEHIKEADLIITGEGKLDEQTIQGKLISGITKLCKTNNKPVIALCGTLSLNHEQIQQLNLNAAFSVLNKPMELEEALKAGTELIRETSSQIAGMLALNFQDSV